MREHAWRDFRNFRTSASVMSGPGSGRSDSQQRRHSSEQRSGNGGTQAGDQFCGTLRASAQRLLFGFAFAPIRRAMTHMMDIHPGSAEDAERRFSDCARQVGQRARAQELPGRGSILARGFECVRIVVAAVQARRERVKAAGASARSSLRPRM